MKGKFLKCFISVLLCVAVFCGSFTVSASADGVIANVGGYLFDYVETLVDSGVVVGKKYFETIDGVLTEVFELDKDNYEKALSAAASTPMPKSGQKVSTQNTTDHLLPLYCPDWGYPDWYCQPYINCDGRLFISTSYLRCFYLDNKLNYECYEYSNSYSSAELSFSKSVGEYDFIFIAGWVNSPSTFCYRFYSSDNVSSFNSYQSRFIYYADGNLRDFVGMGGKGTSDIVYENILDYGYFISTTPFYTNAVEPSSIPDGGSVIIPRNASSFGDLAVRQLGVTPDDDSSGNGSNGGSMNGNITVGGKVEVGGKVDINVNVNSNSEDPNDYIDPGTIETNLDEYLKYVPEVSKGFIDYLKDFFDWLPPPVFGILMLGLVVAVFCRLTGR